MWSAQVFMLRAGMRGLGFQQQLAVERVFQNGFQARIADHEDPTEVSRESFRLISEHGMPRKIYLATLVRFRPSRGWE